MAAICMCLYVCVHVQGHCEGSGRMSQTVTSMASGHGCLMQYGAILHESRSYMCLEHQVIILGLNITPTVAACNIKAWYCH